MTPSIEAVKALDGKIFAMLSSDEQATLDFFRTQGRKHGVSIQIENKADPVALASAKSEAVADAILKSANSIVHVTVAKLSALAPCPKCGESEKLSTELHPGTAFVRCQACNHTGPESRPPREMSKQQGQDLLAAVINAWNSLPR